MERFTRHWMFHGNSMSLTSEASFDRFEIMNPEDFFLSPFWLCNTTLARENVSADGHLKRKKKRFHHHACGQLHYALNYKSLLPMKLIIT